LKKEQRLRKKILERKKDLPDRRKRGGGPRRQFVLGRAGTNPRARKGGAQGKTRVGMGKRS